MKKILFLYEPNQVSLAKGISRDYEQIVGATVDVENALREASIPYTSAESLRTVAHVERLTEAERIGRTIFDSATFASFAYRNIALGELFKVQVEDYLSQLLYFIDLFSSLIERERPEALHVIETGYVVWSTARTIAQFDVRVVEAAAEIVGASYGVPITVLPPSSKEKGERAVFSLKRQLFGVALFFFNLFVSIFVPRKRTRILASELWRNIAPVCRKLPEAELILLDRSEIKKMSMHDICASRVRFMHLPKGRANLKFNSLRTALPTLASTQVSYRNCDLHDHLQSLLTFVVEEGGVRAAQEIEGTYRFLQQKKPDVIVLRASVSAQLHFPILAYVGRQLGIPVIEQQHGLRYLGPGSFEKYYPAEHLATYGPFVSAQMRQIHDANGVHDIGSARFDIHAQNGATYIAEENRRPDRYTVTCIIPDISSSLWNDSYDLVTFVKGSVEALKSVQNVHVVIKMRRDMSAAQTIERIVEETLTDTSHEIVREESFESVLNRTDVVVTYYSTAGLEAMVYGVPTIFFANLPFQRVLGAEFYEYQKNNAVLVAETPEQLLTQVQDLSDHPEKRAALQAGAKTYIDKHYAFHGGSAERFAQLIRSLVG